uniref:Reverse transcriptase domain-containing protein n=1 Tax=Romanomermis culicivorax TaxID=13658 RepID=A0A915ITD7_ROMCU
MYLHQLPFERRQMANYNYKVEYVKGKDNACADFLSRKDDHQKPPIPNTEELTAEIFLKNFRPAGALSDADLMVPDILPAAVSPPQKSTQTSMPSLLQ